MVEELPADYEMPPYRTIPELIDWAAHQWTTSEALVQTVAGDPDQRVCWDWLGLRREIQCVAEALRQRGIGPGDRVGIWAPNIWEFVIAALGVHCAGAALVPVNTRFKGAEAADVLGRAKAKLLFTVTDFLGTDYIEALRTCEAGVPDTMEEIVVLRGPVPAGATSFDALLSSGRRDPEALSPPAGNDLREGSGESLVDSAAEGSGGTGEGSGESVGESAGEGSGDGAGEGWGAGRGETAAVVPVSADDICHIMFTSGTTGQPKGAMLTHAGVTRAFRDWADIVGLREGDRYLIINPFFHSFGLNAGILACFIKGATIIPEIVLDVPTVMGRIVEERISMLPGPPTLYQTILMHPNLADHDLSSLRLAVTGAASIPVEMIGEIKAKLGFETIVTGYGLTEASGMGTMSRWDDPAEVIVNTCGRAIPGLEVRIVDANGVEPPRGEAGEVVLRGYCVMRGYLDDPEKTAETIDPDGWLHTGDIGIMDDDGNVKITDRLKDMFIVGGFNAYPAEIENAMQAHPAIGQVSVIGVPDERQGETGHAFVVVAPGAVLPGAEELTAWCRERMANYKVPRAFEVIDALPLNASGKVLKNVLRARAASSS